MAQLHPSDRALRAREQNTTCRQFLTIKPSTPQTGAFKIDLLLESPASVCTESTSRVDQQYPTPPVSVSSKNKSVAPRLSLAEFDDQAWGSLLRPATLDDKHGKTRNARRALDIIGKKHRRELKREKSQDRESATEMYTPSEQTHPISPLAAGPEDEVSLASTLHGYGGLGKRVRKQKRQVTGKSGDVKPRGSFTHEQKSNTELASSVDRPEKRYSSNYKQAVGPSPPIAKHDDERAQSLQQMPAEARISGRSGMQTPHFGSAGSDFRNVGYPRVWCTNRQELAEGYALDKRFIQYQSGSQYQFESFKGGEPIRVATAILLAGYNSPRDAFVPHAFVTHGGGKNAVNARSQKAPISLSSSQLRTDYNIEALLNAMKFKRDVMIIVGKDYGLFQLPQGIAYAVLAYYRITHIWAEKDAGHVRFKCRFELSPNQSDNIWHLSQQNKKDTTFCTPAEDYVCTACESGSPRVYDKDICLKPECHLFWMAKEIDDSSNGDFVFRPPEPQMKIRAAFLGSTLLAFDYEAKPRDVVPLQPTRLQSERMSVCQWCPRCGRLSRRIHSNTWVCENCGRREDYVLPVISKFETIRLPKVLNERFGCLRMASATGIMGYLVYMHSSMPSSIENRESYKVIYVLPEGGEIHHLLTSPSGSPKVDRIYSEMQKARLEFTRRPVKARIQSMVTSNFVRNSGEAYAQASVLEAKPMSGNQDVEMEAIQLLQDAASEFGTRYNQCHHNLTLPDDRKEMHWHDDGEDRVFGPVSCLSLGSDCVFCFRVKPQWVKKGPGTTKVKKVEGTGKLVLKLRLRHGDILIMVGKKVQKHYEHCARPQGHRISVTTRTLINPETVITQSERDSLTALEKRYNESRKTVLEGVLVFDGCSKPLPRRAFLSEDNDSVVANDADAMACAKARSAAMILQNMKPAAPNASYANN
ncbi:hypothetical protein DFJ77DRAFT_541585 [Powellomyces hirtus]|nr:hypothetical protein DFJ77DRAFT_541585 [Powellomyces hirtus]